MGVFGLWRLLDAAGKPVPVESLEGKILAIDVSIWIHQILQGYQDERGSPVPNAHLVGLFHRICKLLYFKIKPVFVFDGDVPLLKKNTIISRKKQKSAVSSKAQKMKYDLMRNLIKRTAVKDALGKANATEDSGPSWDVARDTSSSAANNMFKLPAKPSTSRASSDYEDDLDSEEEELTPRKQTKWRGNIHSVDVGSAEFKQLPPDVRYDILTDLKETRKQNSWGRLYEMPEETHEFSGYQMKRLLKRRLVQESLEAVEKEIGGKTLTLDELDKLLTEQGIDTSNSDGACRIASDNVTRVIYINDINAAAKAKLRAEEEFNRLVSVVENMNEYELDDEWDSDVELVTDERWASKKSFGKTSMNPALAYMLEHSGLNEEQICFAMEQNKRREKTSDAETRSEEARPGSRAGADEGTPGASNDELGAIFNGKVGKEGESAEEERSDGVKSSSKEEDVPEIERSSDSKHEERSFQGADSRSSSDDFVEVQEAPGGTTEETDGLDPEVPKKPQDEISLPSEVVEKETSVVAVDLDSDSGSDDFVEIQDVEIADALFAGKTVEEKRWEITIKPEDSLGEDLFADVFADDAAEADKSIGAASVGERRSAERLQSSASQIIRPVIEIPGENLGTDHANPESRGEKNDGIDDFSAPSTSANDLAREIVAPVVDREELLSMKTQLESERSALTRSIGSLERQATDITEQMRMEAQELLRLFGIPYVVAPMEAEAQCAYLETIRLTDGTITDDSDIWLFGGQCVYKNFFNSNKHVLQFRSSDIQRHFNLTRRQLIQLALLVGSDYTAGIAGIGPVTALEILAAFPSDGDDLLRGLVKFYRWVKKDGDFGNARTTLRNKLRNVELDKGFPSEAVAQAYLFPTVDESKEGFAWGKPNLVLLGDYAREKFGWTRKKLEDILGPILKRQREVKSQRSIESFFEVKNVPRSIEAGLSKRVQKAVRQLGFGQLPELPEAETETGAKKPPKRRGAKRTAKREEKAVSAEPSSAAESVAKKDESEDKSVDRQKIVKVRADDEYAPERIPQREKDKANALKSKLRAIEVFRKSKRGPGCTKRTKRKARKVTKEAELSESSSSS